MFSIQSDESGGWNGGGGHLLSGSNPDTAGGAGGAF
jgi:hypothetical protein